MGANSFAWAVPSVAGNSLFAVVTDINGKLLESVVRAQKDWVEFVHRRVKEDIAASQQLVKCQSLADMRQIYSEYFQTAFQQYREESERAVERGKVMTDTVVRSMESSAREATQRPRH
jgi:hypothetical protein